MAAGESGKLMVRSLLTIASLLVIIGCSSFPREMAGQFDAQGDFILVKEDGSIYWSPGSKTTDQLRFVGVGSRDPGDPGTIQVVTPSNSPVWPKLKYTPDFRRVTVEWGEAVAGAASDRSTEYTRSSPNNVLRQAPLP